MEDVHVHYLQRAVELSAFGMENNFGGPFGCVIVKDGKIVGEGYNKVTSSNDPTAHAEIVAIRDACRNLASFQLEGCVLYTSCEPCPMCLGAIYWARPLKVFYANTRIDAATAGFDDNFIYDEIKIEEMSDRKIPFVHVHVPQAKDVFNRWGLKNKKVDY